jgi:hypothetical protein
MMYRERGERNEQQNLLVLFIDGAHQSRSRGQDFVHKDEDGLLWSKLDSFTNNVDELTDSQILEYKSVQDGWKFRVSLRIVWLTAGTRYFFLSISSISLLSTFSQMTCGKRNFSVHMRRVTAVQNKQARMLTGIRSLYLVLILSASCFLFSTFAKFGYSMTKGGYMEPGQSDYSATVEDIGKDTHKRMSVFFRVEKEVGLPKGCSSLNFDRAIFIDVVGVFESRGSFVSELIFSFVMKFYRCRGN